MGPVDIAAPSAALKMSGAWPEPGPKYVGAQVTPAGRPVTSTLTVPPNPSYRPQST